MILHQYILTCSALFLDPDLPPLWLLLMVLAINLAVHHVTGDTEDRHKMLWPY